MTLFKFDTQTEPVWFYARKPEHIIDLVTHYNKQVKMEGRLNSPEIADWVRKIPSIEDIVETGKGIIAYHVGMINMSQKGDLFSEHMQVADDFEVRVSPESLLYFDAHRQRLPKSKRKDLYKLQIPGVFSRLYFVPEDIMQAIVNYDLSPHIEKTKKIRERIENVKASHPNLA